MDSKSLPLAGAAMGLIISAGGAGGFLDEAYEGRRFFPLDREPGYDRTGRKLDRSPAAKKALAKKKASKKARKRNARR